MTEAAGIRVNRAIPNGTCAFTIVISIPVILKIKELIIILGTKNKVHSDRKHQVSFFGILWIDSSRPTILIGIKANIR